MSDSLCIWHWEQLLALRRPHPAPSSPAGLLQSQYVCSFSVSLPHILGPPSLVCFSRRHVEAPGPGLEGHKGVRVAGLSHQLDDAGCRLAKRAWAPIVWAAWCPLLMLVGSACWCSVPMRQAAAV